MVRSSAKRHRWSGPELDRSGHVQVCVDCGARKGFFAPQAAKVHGVDTCGRSTNLYQPPGVQDKWEGWVEKRPECRPPR